MGQEGECEWPQIDRDDMLIITRSEEQEEEGPEEDSGQRYWENALWMGNDLEFFGGQEPRGRDEESGRDDLTD